MAKLSAPLQFTGSLGGLSAYTMKGSDAIILRTKGGPTKKQVQRMPENSLMRLNNKEWSACVITGTSIRKALHGLQHLADYNISGPLNGLAKAIQKLDTSQTCGQRAVLLSQHRHWLVGFSFNKNILFDSMVRYPLITGIDRDNGHAQVHIPRLEPGNHLRLNSRCPLFRFVFTLGTVSDVVYNPLDRMYKSVAGLTLPEVQAINGAWWPVNETYPGELLDLTLQDAGLINEQISLVAGIGIEMGQMSLDGVIEPVKFGGSGKVIGVG